MIIYYSNVTPSPQRGKTIQEDYTHVTLGNRKIIPTLHWATGRLYPCYTGRQEDHTSVTLGNRKAVPTLHWATGRPYPRYTGQQEDHTNVTLGNRKAVPTLHCHHRGGAIEILYSKLHCQYQNNSGLKWAAV